MKFLAPASCTAVSAPSSPARKRSHGELSNRIRWNEEPGNGVAGVREGHLVEPLPRIRGLEQPAVFVNRPSRSMSAAQTCGSLIVRHGGQLIAVLGAHLGSRQHRKERQRRERAELEHPGHLGSEPVPGRGMEGPGLVPGDPSVPEMRLEGEQVEQRRRVAGNEARRRMDAVGAQPCRALPDRQAPGITCGAAWAGGTSCRRCRGSRSGSCRRRAPGRAGRAPAAPAPGRCNDVILRPAVRRRTSAARSVPASDSEGAGTAAGPSSSPQAASGSSTAVARAVRRRGSLELPGRGVAH